MNATGPKIWLPRLVMLAALFAGIFTMPIPPRWLGLTLGITTGMIVLVVVLTGVVQHLQLRDQRRARGEHNPRLVFAGQIVVLAAAIVVAVGVGLLFGDSTRMSGPVVVDLGLMIGILGYVTISWNSPAPEPAGTKTQRPGRMPGPAYIRIGSAVRTLGAVIGGVGMMGVFFAPFFAGILSGGIVIGLIGHVLIARYEPHSDPRAPRSMLVPEMSDAGKHDTAGRLIANLKPKPESVQRTR